MKLKVWPHCKSGSLLLGNYESASCCYTVEGPLDCTSLFPHELVTTIATRDMTSKPNTFFFFFLKGRSQGLMSFISNILILLNNLTENNVTEKWKH